MTYWPWLLSAQHNNGPRSAGLLRTMSHYYQVSDTHQWDNRNPLHAASYGRHLPDALSQTPLGQSVALAFMLAEPRAIVEVNQVHVFCGLTDDDKKGAKDIYEHHTAD